MLLAVFFPTFTQVTSSQPLVYSYHTYARHRLQETGKGCPRQPTNKSSTGPGHIRPKHDPTRPYSRGAEASIDWCGGPSKHYSKLIIKDKLIICFTIFLHTLLPLL